MGEWTYQTWAAIHKADARRTHAFNAAVDALCTQPDLGAALSAYNQIMVGATTRWQDECIAAIALSDESGIF